MAGAPYLPAIPGLPASERLPLADATAAQLTSALLADEPTHRGAQFAAAVKGDKNLALWIRSSVGFLADQLSVAELGEWLAEHAFDVLHWPAEEAKSIPLATLVRKLRRLGELESTFAQELQQAKLAAMRGLAYGASHEINNPLANIATRAQTLMRDEPDPDRRRKLATINAQAFRAHEMIADMMLFAMPPRLNFAAVELVSLVRSLLEELQADARDQGTALLFDCPLESLLLPADATQLTVAIRAVCQNSLEALQSGGQVEVAVRSSASPAGAEISIRDTGPGLSDEVRQHLFDPFFSGREAGRGLGLGLSKCWRIVELHGGQILVDSQPGRGTTITLRLPLTRRAL